VLNSFLHDGSALAFPLSVRVTSRFGEVVDFPAIAAMQKNARFIANTQFVNFPALAPAPVWFQPPVYTDSLSNLLGGQWAPAPYLGVTVNPTYTSAAYQGTASLQISNLTSFSGVVFLHPRRFPRPPDGILEFAVRSGTAAAVSNLAVRFAGFDAGGGAASSLTVSLPAIDAAWRIFRIPLAPALAPAQIKELRFLNNSPTPVSSVLLDEIRFRHP
jgi:hypothetical protein